MKWFHTKLQDVNGSEKSVINRASLSDRQTLVSIFVVASG
jgi:hypothetical protein